MKVIHYTLLFSIYCSTSSVSTHFRPDLANCTPVSSLAKVMAVNYRHCYHLSHYTFSAPHKVHLSLSLVSLSLKRYRYSTKQHFKERNLPWQQQYRKWNAAQNISIPHQHTLSSTFLLPDPMQTRLDTLMKETPEKVHREEDATCGASSESSESGLYRPPFSLFLCPHV